MFCVAVFIIAGFGLLIYQLYALQLRDAELYRTEAVTQQLQDTELPATRGNIYSANGKLLAFISCKGGSGATFLNKFFNRPLLPLGKGLQLFK